MPPRTYVGAELRQTQDQPNDAAHTGVLVDVGTFDDGRLNEIRFNLADVSNLVSPLGANGFNIPSLLSVHSTPPYFHNGMAETLEQVLDGSFDGAGSSTLSSVHNVTDSTDRANLIEFLRSIDETTTTFP
jgi:hypothetical protein